MKLIKNDILIPEDSEFKKQIEEFGIIEREKNLTTNEIFNEYKIYENEINSNNNIIGEIVIDCDNINKDIQIINSFENYKRIHNFASSKDDIKYKNKKEIEENTEIKINGKLIKFSYTYKFEKEGKYKIKYFFKNILTKTNHMFDGCNSLTSLNLSNFNTQNVIYMNCMFWGCSSLTSLNLSNFNTQNVTNMSLMFRGCNSLTYLNLSNFNTQNVTDMSFMFSGCNSLASLNLSNLNTQNVTNMRHMFEYCNSLISLNLSNFNTQNVTDMSYMFDGCSSLINLNLSNFNFQNVAYMGGMFYSCNPKIKIISNNNKILNLFN